MKTETYTCDKCKTNVPTAKDLMCVEVRIQESSWSSSYKQKYGVDLCTACAEKLGLVKRIVLKDKIVPELQDTKDELYNIVVKLIQETGIQVEY